MRIRTAAVPSHSRMIRTMTIAALVLTALALLLELQFVMHTTGGTVFLFSTLGPALVLVAIALVGTAIVIEYRQTHKLFISERFDAGQTVFRQGDDGDCAYFIRIGEVEVVDESTGAVLASLHSGQYFGEMALIADAPRNATVRAITPVELAVLGKRNFIDMMKLLPVTEESILGTVRTRALSRSHTVSD
jgi:hypothetical protein